MPSRTKTLVIGASAAGLAVARCLEEAGGEAVVIEQSGAVGAMWRGAYERLHLHTPRGKSGLPFLPMPRDYPLYPSRREVVAYLESYAAQLRHPPLFSCRATSVRREGESWVTETSAGRFVSDTLVIATGNARIPHRPHWDGMDRFSGTILHSAQYRDGSTFAGQRVLVVGFGNSACEIAIDLCENGASPTLAVRGAVNVLPRDILGIPILNLGGLQRVLPARIADAINAPVINLVVGDITKLGLRRLPYGATTQIREHAQVPLLDIGTIGLIRRGAIAVKPGVAAFTLNGVSFDDGSTARYDAVILGTGFRAALSDLLAGTNGVLDADGKPLVSGDVTAAPGLFFCGFRVVSTGHLHGIGEDARRLAALIAN
jgi:cation diffusion facilitator CzcD-associated flavoprotein CzcO